MTRMSELVEGFIKAACIPMDGSWHSTGGIDRARGILLKNPEVATANIYSAAVLGNDSAVRQFLQADLGQATSKGGPYGWDALTYLCFSKFLRLDKDRSEGFVRAATALLQSGADANTGFYSDEHKPKPIFESVLYGAAGVAHHNEMTKLLLDHGADPNDGETEYHAPEWFNNRPMELIVESGRLKPIGLTTMLHRKLDWTNLAGVVWLLDHGADPNHISFWGGRALDHSLGRDNPLVFIQTLLDYGADPRLTTADGLNAFMGAAAMGRADVLELFSQRGFSFVLEDDFAFLEACATGNEELAATMVAQDREIVKRLSSADRPVLANFAGAGNTEGVRILLDLGFDIESKATRPGSQGNTALHLAVWRERLETVKLLISRGASLTARNPAGLTPLMLAEQAQTEMSEWTPHESSAVLDEVRRATNAV
jgi:ankyrin repeat protein